MSDDQTHNAEKMVITPLVSMLTKLSVDDLIAALDKMKLQWTMSRRKDGDHYAAIYKEGVVDYQCSERFDGNESAKAVLANVMARFFVGEQRDFHEYL